MEISVNCDGDLRMDISAQLFNSPIMPEQIFGRECPKQTYFQLWNYEVQWVHSSRLKGGDQIA